MSKGGSNPNVPGQINVQNVVYIHKKILDLKKKGKSARCYKMDGPWTQENKPDAVTNAAWFHVWEILGGAKFMESERGECQGLAMRRGKWGFIVAYVVLFGEDKRSSGDGCWS